MGRPLNKRNLGDTADAGSQISVTADVDGVAGVAGYIVRQRGSKRFEVTTAAGTAVCSLVAGATTGIGTMNINVTDSAAGTYYVSKISGRTCTVQPNTGTEFSAGDKVAWNRTGAVLNESVIIDVL